MRLLGSVVGLLLLLGVGSAAAADGVPSCAASTCTTTYATPGTAAWTAPPGVASASFDVYGAQGGQGGDAGGGGGAGGAVSSTLTGLSGSLPLQVGAAGTAGDVQTVGTGGAPGGGDATRCALSGGGGGGYSAVLNSGSALMIAGGGGGGAGLDYFSGGGAGGLTGGDGGTHRLPAGTAGGGATQSGPGAGGANGSASGTAGSQIAATSGGGTGGTGGCWPYYGGGGGGGGGYYGGGGGAGAASEGNYGNLYVDGAGGGGGSSYAAPGISATYQTGAESGNGKVVISYADPISAPNLSETVLAGGTLDGSPATGPSGDPLTLSITSPPPHGTLTVSGDSYRYVADPADAGTDSFTYTATDAAGDYATGTITITVVPTIQVTTGSASAISYTGATVSGSITGGPGAGYSIQYGKDTGYGQSTAAGTVPSSGAADPTAKLTCLLPSTTYHYRLVATLGGHTYYGADRTFTTLTPLLGLTIDLSALLKGCPITIALP